MFESAFLLIHEYTYLFPTFAQVRHLGHWFSIGGQVCLRRHLTMAGDILAVTTEGVDVLASRGQLCFSTISNAPESPQNKEFSSPTAKVENPWWR